VVGSVLIFILFYRDMHMKFTTQDAMRTIRTRDPTQSDLTGLVNCLTTRLMTVDI
jgi:hypothetical protein